MNWEELFDFTNPESAIIKQHQLSSLVQDQTPPQFAPRLLCGLDAAYIEGWGVGVAAVWDLRNSSLVEVGHAIGKITINYLPGLLAFREGPLLVSASERLLTKPDVFLVDGHGQAHPRRFGLACHVGLALDSPTIGVAKSNLYGRVRGNRLTGPDGSVLGRLLNTGAGRTFFISVGHKISLVEAVRLVGKSLVQGYPAPLRTAHLEATRLRRNLQG